MNFFSLFTLALTAFITLSANQCGSGDTGGAGATMPDALWGVWVHSHEEDYAGNLVFRNPDFDFPPSRGREKYDIKSDGELMYYGLAANDAHGESVRGTWRAIDARTLEIFFPDESIKSFGFELVEITPSRLVVKKLTD
jgi:hypothetical protein